MEDWMTDMDIDILMMLASDLILTPTGIADNIDRSRSGVSRRLNTLDAGGLVERVDEGKYKITWEGKKVITEDPHEEYPDKDIPEMDKMLPFDNMPDFRDPRTGEYVSSPQAYARGEELDDIPDIAEKLGVDEELVETVNRKVADELNEMFNIDEEEAENVFNTLRRLDEIEEERDK
jgi:predicted transcriptional regulator